jgi:hypothetical protein
MLDCDWSSDVCSSDLFIQCNSGQSAPAGQGFRNPMLRGYRVDHCLTWGRDCDRPAADRFCRDSGFARAESWRVEPVKPTLVLGDGNICADGCVGFASIQCAGQR